MNNNAGLNNADVQLAAGVMARRTARYRSDSASFLTEITVKSPQNLFISIIYRTFSESQYPKTIQSKFENKSVAS